MGMSFFGYIASRRVLLVVEHLDIVDNEYFWAGLMSQYFFNGLVNTVITEIEGFNPTEREMRKQRANSEMNTKFKR